MVKATPHEIDWLVAPTTLGPMLLAATARGVCRLSFDEGEADLRRRYPLAGLAKGGGHAARLADAVVAAIEAPGDFAHIALDLEGTPFQRAVWDAVRRIPAGETRTYAQIATAIGHPGSARAVGTANGQNRVAVLVPCHRLVRGDGGLGGYAYGLDRKRELLRREAGACEGSQDR